MRGSFLYFNENNWYNFPFRLKSAHALSEDYRRVCLIPRSNVDVYRGDCSAKKGLVFYNIASQSMEGSRAATKLNHHQQHNYEMTFLSLLLFKSNKTGTGIIRLYQENSRVCRLLLVATLPTYAYMRSSFFRPFVVEDN